MTSYVQWDLSVIPGGSTVTKMEMIWRKQSFPSSLADEVGTIYPLTQNWDENTISNNNKPTYTSSIHENFIFGSGSEIVVDITHIWNWWQSNTNNGLRVRVDVQQSTYGEVAIMYSKVHSGGPILRVHFK